MKRFIKGCTITMVILLIVGVVLGALAVTKRDSSTINQIVQQVTKGKVEVSLDNWKNFGIRYIDKIQTEVNYDIKDASHFSSEHDIYKGNVQKFAVGDSAKELDIEVGDCKFIVKPSGDNQFYAEATEVEKIQCYIEGDCLKLISTTTNQSWDSTKSKTEVVLYVPENVHYEKIDMNLGMGSAELSKLTAQEINLEVGAGKLEVAAPVADLLNVTVGMGQAKITDMRVATFDGDVDMGSLEAEGFCQGNLRAKCAMGSIDMELEGKEEDFNYELSNAMGTLTVGSYSSKGMASEKSIDNNSEKTIEVDCSMGSAKVSFK